MHHGIIRVLKEHWPLNHSDYIARRKKLGFPASRILDSMKLIKAASVCQAQELLPTAFYELAATRVQDWEGVDLQSSQAYLSWQDLARLLVGKERSSQRLCRLVEWDNSYPSPTIWDHDDTTAPVDIFTSRAAMKSCGYSTDRNVAYYCPALFDLLRTKTRQHLLDGKPPMAIFQELQSSYFNKGTQPPCTACIEWFVSVLANKELEMWHNIPLDYDLPKVDKKSYSESIIRPL